MNKTLLGLCAFTLLSACSGPAIKDTALIQQTALSQAQTSEQNPSQAIEISRNLQINAQQEDLYVFSPSYMAQAEKEMAKAEDALKQNKPASVIITHSLTAQALFERGLANKALVTNQLKPSFDGVDMLKEINAHVLVKDDFEDIEDDIRDLVLLIEQGKTNDATKDQKDVLADITELEIETLKVAHLTPAENALEKAEDADAEDFAAKTYDIAEKAVEKLEQVIERQYKDRQLIADSAKATTRLAQHAEVVAKAAKPLLKLNNEQAEQHILYVESLLDRVTQALSHENINHMPLNNQSIALAQAVEILTKQAQAKQASAQWEQEKLTLEATISELKQQAEQTITPPVEAKIETPAATDTGDAETSEPVTPTTNPAADSILAPETTAPDTSADKPTEPVASEKATELAKEASTQEAAEATPESQPSSAPQVETEETVSTESAESSQASEQVTPATQDSQAANNEAQTSQEPPAQAPISEESTAAP